MTDAPAQPGQPDRWQAAPLEDTAVVPAAHASSPAWLPGSPAPDPQPGPWTAVLPPPPRTHRTAVVVLSVLLAVVVAVASGLTWYLLRVNAAWQEHSQQWETLAEQNGKDLAQAQSDLESTRTELAYVQDQLKTAQDRITQLANEKAQLGDQSAVQQQLADYQSRVSKAAGQVATALATCIQGQESLIQYIENESMYDPSSLATYKQNVESYCGSARDANTQLQAELSQ